MNLAHYLGVFLHISLFFSITLTICHLLKSGNLLFTYPHFIISVRVILFFWVFLVASTLTLHASEFLCLFSLQFMLGNLFWQFFYSYLMLISYVRTMHSTPVIKHFFGVQ